MPFAPASESPIFGCMTVGEVCNREVIVCDPEESVLAAAQRMRDRHVGSLVVVEGPPDRRVPVGIVTDRDIVIYAVAAGGKIPERPVRYVMSAAVVSARERESVPDVLERMRARGIRRIPIVDQEGVLQGILTLDDLMELLAEEITAMARLLTNERRREISP
jgi:CBS domain-containing protein